MLRKWLYRLTAKRPCRLISRDGAPYLERYFLCQFMGLTVYLHRFVSGDGDEEVHNHPWHAAALCLTGGYIEERMIGLCVKQGWTRRYRSIFPGFLNIIRANDFHRITRTQPDTWTLFIHGRVRLGWGFLATVPDYSMSGNKQVMFHQPYPLTGGKKWWYQAPKGNKAGRAPYR